MKKFIVWFVPKIQKIHSNQLHIEAKNISEAIEKCNKICEFEIKIIGISNYNGNNFINNKTY
jgi:hypothetical protein